MKDDNEQVYDLLNLIGLPQEASNIIYFVVFAVSLVLLTWAFFIIIKSKQKSKQKVT